MTLQRITRDCSSKSACAVILAGGLGTRIRHLHPDVPKPMVPVAGAPFVEWVVRYLHLQGVRQFVVSLGHLAEVAERYFASRQADGSDIKTVRESTPLGTGGALVFADRAGGSSAEIVLLANGDSLVLANLAPAWDTLADNSIDGVVVGLEVTDAARYGRLDVTSDSRLLRFSEKQPGAGLINGGIYLLRRRLMSRFPQRTPLSMEHDVFPALLASGAKLMVFRCQAPFLDIGTPETIAQADAFIHRYFHMRVAA